MSTSPPDTAHQVDEHTSRLQARPTLLRGHCQHHVLWDFDYADARLLSSLQTVRRLRPQYFGFSDVTFFRYLSDPRWLKAYVRLQFYHFVARHCSPHVSAGGGPVHSEHVEFWALDSRHLPDPYHGVRYVGDLSCAMLELT